MNTDCLVISLIATNPVNGNPILLQSRLTEPQLRILLPLLEWPYFCSHEILLASLSSSWQQLLAGLFPTQGTARDEWLAVVQQATLLLEHASAQGTLHKEVKQLYALRATCQIAPIRSGHCRAHLESRLYAHCTARL
jgi:hypothetical protein